MLNRLNRKENYQEVENRVNREKISKYIKSSQSRVNIKNIRSSKLRK